MFLVMNKEKIYAYLVSIVMVVFLFFMATTVYTDKKSTAVSATNQKLLPIYRVKTEEKR